MTSEQLPELSPQMQRAIEELKGLVQERYPQATFALAPSQDSPEGMHLITTVDTEDPDQVVAWCLIGCSISSSTKTFPCM